MPAMAAAGKLVLSIDDEPSILYVRRVLLESKGYQVLDADCGSHALRLFDSHQVALVLLDYYMPEMTGGSVAAEMKHRKPQVPIIMVSASYDLPESELTSVDCLVAKGQGPEELLGNIAHFIGPRGVRHRTAKVA